MNEKVRSLIRWERKVLGKNRWEGTQVDSKSGWEGYNIANKCGWCKPSNSFSSIYSSFRGLWTYCPPFIVWWLNYKIFFSKNW